MSNQNYYYHLILYLLKFCMCTHKYIYTCMCISISDYVLFTIKCYLHYIQLPLSFPFYEYAWIYLLRIVFTLLAGTLLKNNPYFTNKSYSYLIFHVIIKVKFTCKEKNWILCLGFLFSNNLQKMNKLKL